MPPLMPVPKNCNPSGLGIPYSAQFLFDNRQKRVKIKEEGKIEKPIIIKKLGAGCDEEALRVLKKVKFTPGYDKGKAVKVRFTLPVRFML